MKAHWFKCLMFLEGRKDDTEECAAGGVLNVSQSRTEVVWLRSQSKTVTITPAETHPRQTTDRRHKVHSNSRNTPLIPMTQGLFGKSTCIKMRFLFQKQVHDRYNYKLMTVWYTESFPLWLWGGFATFDMIFGVYITTSYPCEPLCPAPRKKGTAGLHRSYFWCRAALMMLTGIAFPHGNRRRRSDRTRGTCEPGPSSCSRGLNWPQAPPLVKPKHQQRVITSTREALNFFTPLSTLWGHRCAKGGRRREKGEGTVLGFVPKVGRVPPPLPPSSLSECNSCTPWVN